MSVPSARSRIARRLTAVFVVLAVLSAGTEALAAFDSSHDVGHSLSTAVLDPPTDPAAATSGCDALLLHATATVTWTATGSSWADGYEVLTSGLRGGPYSVAATVSSVSTTSADIGALALGSTTYIVVRATKSAWRSPQTVETSYTAPLLCI